MDHHVHVSWVLAGMATNHASDQITRPRNKRPTVVEGTGLGTEEQRWQSAEDLALLGEMSLLQHGAVVLVHLPRCTLRRVSLKGSANGTSI